MKQSDTDVRRYLLKPLVRRRFSPAQHKKIEVAFRELEERAAASSVLPELATQQKLARENRQKDHWKDPITAKSWIDFAFAMYLARRISLQEYVFMVAHSVEGVHEGRIASKTYPELEQMSFEVRKIEQEHGLGPSEYWQTKDAPPEYRQLSLEWSAAENRRFIETLNELEGHEVASLFASNKGEFERLRERGRRSFFHKDELIPALVDTVKRYELEAKAAAKATAFTAAVTMLGAAMEGLLLLRCLRSKTKAMQNAKALSQKLRPKNTSTLTRWSFDNLIQVCLHAGWLPLIETTTLSIKPDDLAQLLKQMRNQVHPGRACSDRPWIEATQREFDDAELIYSILYAAVFRGAMLRRFAEFTGE
jgi:hypothetical protein